MATKKRRVRDRGGSRLGIHVFSQPLRSLVLSFCSHVDDARSRRVSRSWNQVSLANHDGTRHRHILEARDEEALLCTFLRLIPTRCVEQMWLDRLYTELDLFERPNSREMMIADVRDTLVREETELPCSFSRFLAKWTGDIVADAIVDMGKSALADEIVKRTVLKRSHVVPCHEITLRNTLFRHLVTSRERVEFLVSRVPRRSPRVAARGK